MNGHEEDQAALRTAVLERHSTPGTLAPRHRLVEEEAAELGRAIEALADERDRLVRELKVAQEQIRSPSLRISSQR